MAEEKLKPKIAVTGATGLVGSHVVEYFASLGYQVVAIVRSATTADYLLNFRQSPGSLGNVKVVQGFLADSGSLRAAFEGADVVVHAAGSVDPHGSRQAIFDTNVNGTKNALAAAKLASVQQFIHISSLSVITGQGDQFNVKEDAPLRPCGEAYADSKVEAEKAVMKELGNIRVTILRPGFIYGPRERSWMPRLISSITNGQAMLIDGGKRETNVIYIGNLCRAIEGALLNTRTYGQAYNLTDGQKISKKQLFDAIADGLALKRVTKVVPRPVAWAACELVSAIAPSLPKEQQQKLARFSRAAFRLAAVNQGFDITKAEQDLGYTKRIPFSQGMAHTLESFRTTQPATGGSEQLQDDLSGSQRR